MKSFVEDNRNLTMLMDFYELTMSNGYFVKGLKDQKVVFDMFYRRNPDNGGFVIFAGLAGLAFICIYRLQKIDMNIDKHYARIKQYEKVTRTHL
jgi:nicotinic acid phosphoribosyltransferase